jgi:hypothetical protein
MSSGGTSLHGAYNTRHIVQGMEDSEVILVVLCA